MSIGSDSGWVLNKQQAIIWTNDSVIYQQEYALLILNDLFHWPLWKNKQGG